MIASNDNDGGTTQIQMTLTSKDTITSNNKTNFTTSGALSDNERTDAVNSFDNLFCQMIDDSFTEIEENMKSEDD